MSEQQLEMNNEIPKVCQSVAVGRAITEPVSIWLARQYMQTRIYTWGIHRVLECWIRTMAKAKLEVGILIFPIQRRPVRTRLPTAKDLSKPCSAMFACPTSPGFAVRLYNELNEREQREITDLLTNQPAIAGS